MAKDWRVSPVDQTEIVYAAALYEGEGTIGKGGKGSSPWVKIRMCDPEPLTRVHAAFKGHFYGPYRDRQMLAHHRDRYSWTLNAWRDVVPFCNAVRPFLSARRKAQMDRVLRQAPEVPRGVLNCPSAPEASSRGYYRHIRLNEEPCEICRKSLYLSQKKGWKGRSDVPLACPPVIRSSYTGYLRHLQTKTPVCDICRNSARVYDHRRYWTKRRRLKPRPPLTLDCPEVPFPSCRGYQRHKTLGIPACANCKKSVALYQAGRKARREQSVSVKA